MSNASNENFEVKLKALWKCGDYENKSYDKPEIDKWTGGDITKENLWLAKSVIDNVKPQKETNQSKEDYEKKENEWKNWKKTKKTDKGESYDKIVDDFKNRAEKSYYYYLSQKNKNINGSIQPSGIGKKLVISKNPNGNIDKEEKYYIGTEEMDQTVAENTMEEISKTINDIKKAKTMDDLIEIENNNEMPEKLRHKLMMLRSLEVDGDIKLLFVDTGIDKYYDNFVGGKDKNWVAKNNELTKEIAGILFGKNKEKYTYEDIKRMSVLLWDYDHRNELFTEINDDKCKQIIYTGAPGTGKTYGIRKYVKYSCMLNSIAEEQSITGDNIKQYKFVQFHSTYDYSDFVEGLRPAKLNAKSNDTTFVRMDGVFKSFCRDVVAYNEKYEGNNKKFYFIIDEINRADLGKVFGELMYGLEESYRGKENAVETQYRNLPTYYYDKSKKEFSVIEKEKDCFEDGFYIPENVYIIGSMNDIDRSVETFDFALRRRFKWINVGANEVMEKTLESMLLSNGSYSVGGSDDKLFKQLVGNIKNLNEVISGSEKNFHDYNGSRFRLSEAYQIGPAYFKNFDGTKESLENLWKEKVEPILREYVRGYEKTEIENFINLCKDQLFEDNIIKLFDGSEDDPENDV